MAIRSTPARNYQEPSDLEIQTGAIASKITEYDLEIVRDIANIQSGGTWKSDIEIIEQLKEAAKFTSFDSIPEDGEGGIFVRREGFHNKEAFKGSLAEKGELAEKWSLMNIQEDLADHNGIKEVLQGIDYSQLKGSPFEKALAAGALIRDALGGSKGKKVGTPSQTGRPHSFRRGREASKEMSQRLNSTLKIINQIQANPNESFYKLEGENVVEQARYLQKNPELLRILQAAANFNSIQGISTKTSTKIVKDPLGTEKHLRPLKDFSQLGRLSSQDIVLPTKLKAYKLLQGETLGLENFKKDKKIPSVILLIDDSGSMTSKRADSALGILYALLTRVCKKEMYLLFSFFETSCHEFFWFTPDMSVEHLKKFWEKASSHDFSTGGTDVGKSSVQAIKEYERVTKGMKGLDSKQKHIVLVNDGDDDVSSLEKNLHLLKGAKIHSFILDNRNPALEKISRQTGGIVKFNV